MPKIGLGTYMIPDCDPVVKAVNAALKAGYRHVDTASVYGNEKGVGTAIKESGMSRKEMFLVSKVWNADHGYGQTLRAFEHSLGRLGTDYLDLYLIHWPRVATSRTLNDKVIFEQDNETWKALEKLYKTKRVRAIGVSNFNTRQLKKLMKDAKTIPMVNQVELHPQFPQDELREFCKKHNIVMEAWAPLMQGKVFEIQLMKDLAKKYGKDVGQITLRWHYQRDVVVIPKSTRPDRIVSNAQIFDFEISEADMEKVATLKGERIGPDPENIDF